MMALRMAVLCGVTVALGGCLSIDGVPRAYTALQPPPRMAVSNAPLPPVVEPGQRLGASRAGSGGVDPYAALAASEQMRHAWKPQRLAELAQQPADLTARTAGSTYTTGMSTTSGAR